jgi:hypothetical protein
VIADIDANIRQVSGDFGEQVSFLKGFEGGVGLETLGHRGAARMHDVDPRRAIRLRRIHWRWRCRQMPIGNDARGADADHDYQGLARSIREIHGAPPSDSVLTVPLIPPPERAVRRVRR